MSRRADCYDNAVMESFFSTVKSERANRFATFGEGKTELFDYIEVFTTSDVVIRRSARFVRLHSSGATPLRSERRGGTRWQPAFDQHA